MIFLLPLFGATFDQTKYVSYGPRAKLFKPQDNSKKIFLLFREILVQLNVFKPHHYILASSSSSSSLILPILESSNGFNNKYYNSYHPNKN